MFKHKKLVALLVCLMFVFASTAAFAAVETHSVYDLDGNLFATGKEMNLSASLQNQVTVSPSKFLYGWEGKLYKMEDAQAAYQEVGGNMEMFGYAITKKTPVEIEPDGDLKVVSVEAINANEIQVTFSGPVDDSTATETENYVVTINNLRFGQDNEGKPYNDGKSSEVIKSVVLSDDKQVATLKLKADEEKKKFPGRLDNGDKYGVDVRDGIYSADMSTRVEKYGDTQKVFEDYDAPKLLDVSIDAKGHLVLTFDEPIYCADLSSGYPENEQFKVTVDGDKVAMGEPSTDPLVYTVASQAPLTDDHVEEGVHEVVVYNARDLVLNNGAGGNKAPILKGYYSIGEAEYEEPVVVDIEPLDFNSFEVVFSEPVERATIIVTKGSTEFYNQTDEEVGGNTHAVDLPVTSVSTRYGVTPLYAEGAMSTTVVVTVKDYQASASKLFGKEYTTTLTLNRDAMLPKALGDSNNSIVESDDGTGNLVVLLNRAIDKLDSDKITVKDKDGIPRLRLIGYAKIGDDDKKDEIIITLQKDDGTDMSLDELKELAPFTVEFAAGALKVDTDKVDVISDKHKAGDEGYKAGEPTNTLENEPHSTKVIDKEADKHAYKAVEAVEKVEVDNNVITVTYKEEMGRSAADLANYTLDGDPMPAGTKIAMAGNNKKVTITLPEGTFAKDVFKKLVISTDVMTKAGSYVVGNLATKEPYMSQLLEFQDNTKPELVKAQFVVTDPSAKTTDTIRLTFSENVTGQAAIQNFVAIIHDGTEIAVASVPEVTADDTVDITLSVEVNMDQTVKVRVVPESESGKAQVLEDKNGNTLKEGTIVTVSGTVQ